MRPVDKGESPYRKMVNYQDAEPYLNERIGRYCSFCEMPIFHVPEVEHKEGKFSGGDYTSWENLLYSCKYCNTRKAQKIKKGESANWLWPDRDNTFLAFSYEGGLPAIKEGYLKDVSVEAYEKARAVFDGIALNFQPQGIRDKDKRWMKRIETLGIAEESKAAWQKMKGTDFEDDQLKNITIMAKSCGFFSVWMMVFKEEKKVKKSLIKAFRGTASDCFDDDGNAVRRPHGIL